MATDTRERLLDAAEALVLDQGFAATTVDAVLARAGASKGAFFHHFPSKAALGRALVARYAARDEEILGTALAAAEATSDDPAEQLLAFVQWFEEAGRDPATAPSCLFVSFIYERRLVDEETDELIVEAIATWRRALTAKLEAAAVDHPALAEVDLASLADAFFTTVEGAFLLGRATGDPLAASRQLAHLRRYLALLLGEDPGVSGLRASA